MRKILAYILVLAITTGLFVMPVSATEAEISYELTDAEKTLMGLGVVDKAEYSPDALLSRAEFASLIAELCGFVPDNKAYLENMQTSFGSDNKDELITSSEGKVFDDVDSTMKEFDAINAMCARNYMTGITASLFGPYYDITAGEVVKVLVSMLGRDYHARYAGGYPTGYMNIARKIKLTTGVSLDASDFVTLRDAVTMIYNAFEINVYELTGIGTDGDVEYTESNKTFLNYCADIYIVEGNMTDNGITTYYGNSQVGQDKVVIGGVSMYIGSADYARGYLGRELIAYYIKDDSDRRYLVYASTYEDNSITFSAADFAGYSSSAIKYFDENGKLVTASVSGADVIYNNTSCDRYNENTFRFLFGDITLVSTSGSSTYDVIIVNDYMVGKINRISSVDKMVYSDTLYSSMNGVKTLDLKEESGKTIIITDANGNKVDFEALSAGNVISVAKNADGSYINIKVCSAGVTNFEISDYVLDGCLTVSDGEREYTLRGVSALSGGINIKPGELYDLYLDYEGNLIYLEALIDSTDLKKAFLADAAPHSNGLSNTYAIKLYTQDGELKVYNLEDKLLLNHSSVKAAAAMTDIVNAKGRVVLYREDKDTQTLKAMVTPLEFGAADTDDRGWYAVIPYVRLSREVGETKTDFDNDQATNHADNKFKFLPDDNMLNKAFKYNEKTSTLFAVPATKEEYDDVKKFYVDRLKFNKEDTYYLNAYDTEIDAIAPEAIAFSAGGGSASGDTIAKEKAFLISRIMTTVDSEDEEIQAYKGYIMDANNQVLAETTLAVSTEVDFVDSNNQVGAPAVALEPGDIIRYATNSDGAISAIFVAYDMSAGAAYPFSDAWGAHWYSADAYTGYVYNIDGDYMRITAAEPHTVPTDPTNQYRYFIDRTTSAVQKISKKILVVEQGRNGITVRTGTKDDIVSYKDSGDLASGAYDKVVGIEYSWGVIIANVIYK